MQKKNSRKDFLKLLGLGTFALSIPGTKLFSLSDNKPKLGIQLYTVRKALEKNLEQPVRKIAETGYLGIETYPLPANASLKQAAALFKETNLEIFAMHCELPVGKNIDPALEMADTYNCNLVVYHGWPEGDKYKGLDSVKQTIQIYNETAAFLKTKGLKLGLHNHWWEFEKTSGGIYPFYYLLENLDKEILFEIDTYWVKTAGQDPAKVVNDFGERAPLLHIKDGPAVKGDSMYKHVPAGQGSLDFYSIVKAGGENIKWMIVEFDEYEKDIFDGIKKSYDYLTKNNLAEGRV